MPGVLSLGLLFLAAGANAAVDNPTPENFLRRFFHAAVRVGDYVYIDGGFVSQLEDGATDDYSLWYTGKQKSFPYAYYSSDCWSRWYIPSRK